MCSTVTVVFVKCKRQGSVGMACEPFPALCENDLNCIPYRILLIVMH